MSKPTDTPEDRARKFIERVNRWHERHATRTSKPECPICSGMRWAFVTEEGTVGGVKVYPRYCLSCGYTMFVKAELLG
jgi:hypothetical protein